MTTINHLSCGVFSARQQMSDYLNEGFMNSNINQRYIFCLNLIHSLHIITGYAKVDWHDGANSAKFYLKSVAMQRVPYPSVNLYS